MLFSYIELYEIFIKQLEVLSIVSFRRFKILMISILDKSQLGTGIVTWKLPLLNVTCFVTIRQNIIPVDIVRHSLRTYRLHSNRKRLEY